MITLLNTIYRRNMQIDWDSAAYIIIQTINQWLTLESWFTYLEQTPLNRSQQLPAPYKRFIDGFKQNWQWQKDW